jgi:hypothetical protein
MKAFYKIILLLVWPILCTSLTQRPCKKVEISRFKYNICTVDKYLHDDNLLVTYFLVYGHNAKKSLCSAVMLAKHNKDVATKGNYMIERNSISFKEVYFMNKNKLSSDSLVKKFCPDKYGNLILRQIIEYRNGGSKTIEY